MLKIRSGNVLNSKADVVLHQVNCYGVMGEGMAKQVKERYPAVYDGYRWYIESEKRKDENGYKRKLMGSIYAVEVQNPVTHKAQTIVNLFGQKGYGTDKRRTNYYALEECLDRVNEQFAGKKVAIPYKMSCGLGGGRWKIVQPMIEKCLKDCDVTVYRLPDYKQQY